MQVNKTNNVSFGYRMTPSFVERYGRSAEGTILSKAQETLNKISNMGSDKITLHYKKGVMVVDPRDVMIFPKKYNYTQEIYGDNFREYVDNLESQQLFGVKTILGKAMKKGKMEEVAQSLIEDFPNMQKEIEKISKDPVYMDMSRINAQKGIFTRIKEALFG